MSDNGRTGWIGSTRICGWQWGGRKRKGRQKRACGWAAPWEEGLAISREHGDKRGIAWCLFGLGMLAHSQGDYSKARALYEEPLAIYRELESKSGIAWALQTLGEVAHDQGDNTAARAFY